MKKKILIITANELRHIFFRRKISNNKNFEVCLCLSEDNLKRQSTKFFRLKKKNKIKSHFLLRQIYEKKYFKSYIKRTKEVKNLQIIKRGQFNKDQKLIKQILNLSPDYLLSYGCSIIKNPLLNHFKNNSLNIHLGLSPYYLGSGTNFWPFVNNELQFVGVTFMKLNEGIDDGPIIHQIRPNFKHHDNVHTVGNRLIKDTTVVVNKILKDYEKLKVCSFKKNKKNRIFFKADIKEDDIDRLLYNQNNMIIKKYLKDKNKLIKKFPIYSNKLL